MFDTGMVVLQNCMDLLKTECDSCSGSCVTSDDGNENIDVKVEEDPDLKEEQDPLAMTSSSVKSEHEVSVVSSEYLALSTNI
jgi:hypothetical protein